MGVREGCQVKNLLRSLSLAMTPHYTGDLIFTLHHINFIYLTTIQILKREATVVSSAIESTLDTV